ncbi:hypothetical protein JTS99_16500 [Clostridium botulinum]|nr:hypothetical protein [Clostridium botulinum]
MKFIVAKEVFENLDNVCFGIVVAKGLIIKKILKLLSFKRQYRI